MSPVPDWRWANQWLPEGQCVINVSVTFLGHTSTKQAIINVHAKEGWPTTHEDEIRNSGGRAAVECLRGALIEEYGLNDSKLGREHFCPPGWKPESEQ